MAYNEADWELLQKAMAQHQRNVAAEIKQEEKDKKNSLDQYVTDSAAKAKEDGKKKEDDFWGNLWNNTGGKVAGAVGDIAAGGAQFVGETVSGIGGLINTQNQMNKQQEYRKNKDEYLKQFLGNEETYLAESAKYDKQHAGEQGDVKGAFKEQARNSKAFDEAGQKFYKGAQYIPGFSLGVESAGTLGALAQGDDSDINKRLINLTQGKDWDKLSDKEKQQALVERNVGGALSTLDLVLPGSKVATTSLKEGTKGLIKGGLKEGGSKLLSGAAEGYGKSLLSSSVKDVLKKTTAKQITKSAIGGGIIGSGIGVGLEAYNGGNDYLGAAEKGFGEGLTGGILGSPIDSAGNVTKNTVKNATEDAVSVSKRVDLTDTEIPAALRERALKDGTGYVPEGKSIQEVPEAQKMLPATRENSADLEEALAKMQRGEYDDSLFDIQAKDGSIFSPEDAQAATDRQTGILGTQRDQLSSQLADISDNVNQTISGGQPTLNVGMNIGDKKGLTRAGITKVLKDEFGVKVKSGRVRKSGTEDTFIPTLDRELSEDELFKLSEILQQDAIAAHTGKTGMLAGPKAADWGGKFAPEYYMNAEGNNFADLVTSLGDEGATYNKLQSAISELDDKIAGLKNGDSSSVSSVFGEGSSKTLNVERLRAMRSDLQKRLEVARSQELADRRFAEENTYTGSDRAVDDIDGEIRGIQDGSAPHKVDGQPFRNALQVAEAMPQLNDRVQALHMRKMELQDEIAKTPTPDSVDARKAELDMKRQRSIDALGEIPDVRMKYEMQKIDQQYLDEIAAIDDEFAQSGDRGFELQSELEDLLDEERNLVNQANFVRNQFPDRFQVVDTEAQGARLNELKKEKVANSNWSTPEEANSVIVETARQTQDPKAFASKIDNDAAVRNAFQQKVDSMQSLAIKTEKPGANLLGTPTNVLRRWGARGQAMADTLESAHFDFARGRGAFEDKMFDWSRALRSKDGASAGRVFDSLDGKTDVKLSPEEQAIRSEIRAYFDEKAVQLGLDPDMKISEYIPHMFEKSFGRNYTEIEKIAAKIRYGVDEAGKKISKDEKELLARQMEGIDAETLQFIRANNSWKMKNGFLEKRTGAEGYSKDLFKVLDAYDNAANKKIHYEPALELLNAVSDDLATQQKTYLTQLFGRIRGDHSSLFENTMDRMLGDGNTAKLLSGQRRLSNASIMGGSPLTWVKNLQDVSKVIADRPAKHLVTAIPDAIRAMKYGSSANRELFRNGIMDSNMATFLKGMASDGNVTRAGKVSRGVTKGENALWSGMRAVDAFTRALNYKASIREFMDANPGGSMDDAIKFAQKTNRDTVFTFSNIDIPVGLNNAIGRSTLNMQTYNLETSKYILKKFGDVLEDAPNGRKRLSKEGMFKLSKYVAANTVFMMTVGSALGLKPEELVPFGNEVSGGELPQSPIVAQLMGNKYQEGLIPTGSKTISELFKAATGKDNNLADAAAASGEALGDFAQSMIPGRTQFNRTKQGIESVASGQARSQSGNIQFNQDQDPLNAMMAAVFGKNTTDAGKQWKDEGSKTLAPFQMDLGSNGEVSIDDLPEADKRRYVEMYNAVNNANPYDFDAKKDLRGKTVARARAAASEGNANKVRRIIQEYNQQAGDTLSEFVNANQGMLTDPMKKQINRLFIDEEDIVK